MVLLFCLAYSTIVGITGEEGAGSCTLGAFVRYHFVCDYISKIILIVIPWHKPSLQVNDTTFENHYPVLF